MFESARPGPPDPMFTLKKLADGDTSPNKVDLGVGVYRNEQAGYHELEAIKQAKKILDQRNPGHDYEVTIGNPTFLKHAAELIFGPSSQVLQDKKVASVQTISGTGANHIGALFLSRSAEFSGKTAYVGIPAWGNYDPIFRLVGLEVVKYKYYDIQHGVYFPEMLHLVKTAPAKSIFVLQSCCHNPTGADLTKKQWDELADAFKERDILPFFDIAYQGLGAGLDEDAYGIRRFAELGLEFVVAQSFAKNFGLYGERAGVLHIVGKDQDNARNIGDQLRCLVRWEFSSSPAYGSRLVTIVLEDAELTKIWRDELDTMKERLLYNRRTLYNAIANELKVPGNWEVITLTQGLFCILPLTPQQCILLRERHHIHLPESGRINVAGLNKSNFDYVARAIQDVVKSEGN
ncbi:aspartate aminotransferase [Annulohypoxylon stygium]|nr:aspartate aminotransferase [Annulohypoxylon stygium]